MGGCNFGKILTIEVPKCHRKKICFLMKKLSNSSELFYLEPALYPCITDIIEAMNAFIQEGHNHSESCITVKCLDELKKLKFTVQKKNLFLHSLVRTRDTFPAAMLTRKSD